MLLKNAVIRLTVVEGGHYLGNVKAHIFIKQTFPKLQAENGTLAWTPAANLRACPGPELRGFAFRRYFHLWAFVAHIMKFIVQPQLSRSRESLDKPGVDRTVKSSACCIMGMAL